MIDLDTMAKTVRGMGRDLESLGDCKKMLASPTLYEAMVALHVEGAVNAGNPDPPVNGTLYFKGAPTIKCDHLQGMEYAFVK